MDWITFGIAAALAVGSALAMLFSRNAVHSALFLLLNFATLAVFYLALNATFLFAVQLIVYAGAIIVLFLFVVMLLGAEQAESPKDPIGWQRPLAVVLGLGLLGLLSYIGVTRTAGSLAMPVDTTSTFSEPTRIAVALFTTYLLPFQIAGIILLAAVVGVVVLHGRQANRTRE